MENIILTILAVLAAAGCVAAAVFFARNGLSTHAKRILLGLVAEAEAYFGAGTGAIKLSSVLGKLYAAMPPLMQILFRRETIEGWIEEAVSALKAYLRETEGEGC
ncbi:MAG: hypothetical protein J6D31_02050 [Clostridia bacterium]|nr:hypothetical protein [Clostridia bacterium]